MWRANVPAITLSHTAVRGPFPRALTGSLTGFLPNETVTYRLDAATALTGSPAAVDGAGAAGITSLSIPAAAEGAHVVHAIGGQGSQASVPIVVDTVAPVVSSSASPAANGNGWHSSVPVQVTLAGTDGSGSGVAQIRYTTDGSDPVSSGTAQTYAAPFAVTSSTTVRFVATDVAGNSSATGTRAVTIDTTAPGTPVLSFSALSNAYWNGGGSTVWYRGGQSGGSFTVTASSSDAQSGIGSWAMPNLGTGWTAPGTTSPQTYAWSSAHPAVPGTVTVTAHNAAGLSASAPFSATPDNTGPAGGSVDFVNGAAPASITVTFSAGTDAGVGVLGAAPLLQRAQATLTGNTCGSFGAFATVTGGTNPSSPFTDATPAIGRCYRYQYVVADVLGNTTTYGSANVAKRYSTYAAAVGGAPSLGRWYRLGEATISADNMTGATGATLQSRAGETAATWTKLLGSADGIITDLGRLRKGGNSTYGNVYYTNAIPPSADYKVEAYSSQKADNDIRLTEDAGGLVGRVNTGTNSYYMARREHYASTGYLRLYRVVNGTPTKIGEYAGIGMNPIGDWFNLSLDMNGTTIRVLEDGLERISYVDTTANRITAAGRAGITLGDALGAIANTHTNSHGLHFDNFRVTPPMADETGAADGLYYVTTTLGGSGALTGDSNTAAAYNGGQDSSRAARPVLDTFTAEYWFKSTQGLYLNPGFAGGAALVDADATGAADDWGSSLRSDGRVVAGVGDAGGSDVAIQSATGFNDGAWHHVAFTRNGVTGALALYVDGVLQATGTGPATTRDAGTLIRFGRRASDGANAYLGSLDEVAVYHGELSAQEILAHHNLGRGQG
ncbi:hypothetical protein Sya03_58330 [Spirilliplanes yamanashiensis]|uniref:LamG-like jellyroll fold domain-containing protein n=1 Tax=Spirilliplanes yamanashiensis TaxID=42233 RepID=A0A8J3YCY7_9ACTN|nr:hypothetical protein Sya03_58330 [Spirilliplanes yamanashiensis]